MQRLINTLISLSINGRHRDRERGEERRMDSEYVIDDVTETRLRFYMRT